MIYSMSKQINLYKCNIEGKLQEEKTNPLSIQNPQEKQRGHCPGFPPPKH